MTEFPLCPMCGVGFMGTPHTCEHCKWWLGHGNFGECSTIHVRLHSYESIAFDEASTIDRVLFTGKDFSCIHWEREVTGVDCPKCNKKRLPFSDEILQQDGQ